MCFNAVEGGESAEDSSVGEESVAAWATMRENEPAVESRNFVDVACLKEGDRWLMQADGKEFSRHLSKLVCEYLIALVEHAPFDDPVMSLESFYDFLSNRNAKLKMRRVTIPGGTKKLLHGTVDVMDYVVDDIGWDSRFDRDLGDGVFLIEFRKYSSSLGLSILRQLFKAMLRDEVYDISKNAWLKRTNSMEYGLSTYLWPMLGGVLSLRPPNALEAMQVHFESLVQRSMEDIHACKIDTLLFKEFVLLTRDSLLRNVLRCVHGDLLFAHAVEGDGQAVTNHRDNPYDGLFASALIRMPFRGFHGKIGTKLTMESVGWPRIFLIAEGRYIHVLGTVERCKKAKKGIGYALSKRVRFKGCCRCQPQFKTKLEKQFDFVLDCLFGAPVVSGEIYPECLGVSLFDFFIKPLSLQPRDWPAQDDCGLFNVCDTSFECHIMPHVTPGTHFGVDVMNKLYGCTWKKRPDDPNSGHGNYRFIAMSYKDSIDYFYRDLLLLSLRDLEKQL